MKLLRYIAKKYLNKRLDFRVRLFNILAMAGFFLSLIIAGLGVAIDAGPLNVAANLVAAALAFLLLVYTNRSGRYQLGYMITIVIVFLVLFPILFFSAGGYHSGMPSFFIFAVLFTFIMLDGKRVFAVAALELLAYAGICLHVYYRPESVSFLQSEAAVLTDTIVSFVSVSLIVGVTLYLHFRLYNQQQRLLAEQNRQLAEANRMKTELFAGVSHEMKTPLTVVSVHIQRAETLMKLNRPGDEEKIQESFALAQDEIMRMSRMVDNSLKFSSLQELGGQHVALDLGDLLRTTAEAYRALLEKRGNTLMIDLPDSLPPVLGSADNLVTLLSNLLANAGAHTKDGEIRMSAKSDGDTLTLTIADNGVGIPPELLPRAFNRGVSGSGGSGLGLAISKEIAEAHGGKIVIESEPQRGTTVTVTLPAYREENRHA